ncbi:MAG: von Willebrand factor type A domain-containing protein [Bacteroidetes bacterium]|nr:von Willebrand factor type A domain-containing protein [Bacteroidota bacterium]
MKLISLKKTLQTFLFCCAFIPCFSQYYLRGEIKDETNQSVGNAKIQLHSNNYFYYPDTSGNFEILINSETDSVTISANGFKPLALLLEAGQYQSIILNSLENGNLLSQRHLMSISQPHFSDRIKDLSRLENGSQSLVENVFEEAAASPQTIFAVNPEKISYNNINRYIGMNSTVPADAIRTEELFNYFNLGYQEPAADSNFKFDSYVSKCPWNEQNQLLFFHASAKKIDLEKIPSANLVFLIDVTGTMGLPNRLPLLKSAFRFLINNLREKDTVSIVVYGKSASIWLPPTSGSNKSEILKAIEELKAGGASPGDVAIKAAYTIAENQFIQGGNNRIILATDGEFNIGESTQEELEKMIMMHKRWGIYFSCLGVGLGNIKDEKLHVLAERGNGNMTYIDDERHAEKALMREFAQIIYAVADSAYFEINLDSNLIKSYRLIGFENKVDALKDPNSKIVGGEMGSEGSLMALFEITPRVAIPATEDVSNKMQMTNFGNIVMHYKMPGDSTNRYSYYQLSTTPTLFSNLPKPYRFASSIALYAGLLKKSSQFGDAGWNDAMNLLSEAYNPNDIFQKEFEGLMRKAKKIYARDKKKKPVNDFSNH